MAFEVLEDEPKKEGWGEWAVRNIVRSGARAAETALGLPGTLYSGAQELKHRVVSPATPTGVGTLGEKEGFRGVPAGDPRLEAVRLQPGAGELRPTTETDIRKGITEPLLGEYAKPKGETEEAADEFVQDVTAMLMPIPGIGKAAKLSRAFKLAGVGQLSKYLAKSMGKDKETQQKVKMGSQIAYSLLSPLSLKKFAGTLGPEGSKSFLKEIKQASKLQGWMSDTLGPLSKAVNPVSAVLLGQVVGPKGLALGGAWAALRAEQVFQMLKVPEVRSYYGQALKAAARRDGALFLKNAQKLDEKIDAKQEKLTTKAETLEDMIKLGKADISGGFEVLA